MYTIKTMNKIADIGIKELPEEFFKVDDSSKSPQAILVRSASLHEMPMDDDLLCIARAGAGVNNIPVDTCSEKSVVVFNTPGANAGAVKELVICSLFLASRNIIGGINWCKSLTGDVSSQVEKGKSAFTGPEIYGKTLGIIGLGAIGVGVANAAHHLGMKVLGFDPYISVDAAWGLSRNVHRIYDIKRLLSESDYITLHVPLNNETREMLSGMLTHVKKGVRIINLARGGLIDTGLLLEALDNGTVASYVTDFPDERLLSCDKVVPIPHLGASTPESEDNCAVMAASELREYLLYGTIKNSVNYPDVQLPHMPGYRLCVFHENIPNTITEITAAVSKTGINIENMLSKSKKNFAYTILDCAALPSSTLVDALKQFKGIRRVRLLKL